VHKVLPVLSLFVLASMNGVFYTGREYGDRGIIEERGRQTGE